MNALLAIDLFLASVLLSHSYIPWGKTGLWFTRYSARGTAQNFTVPTGVVTELQEPLGFTPTEKAQRERFLERSQSFLTDYSINTTGMSQSDVVMEFNHVDTSPSITFDSITWEIDGDPSVLSTNTSGDNTTNYTTFSSANCGPWPAICSFRRQESDTPVVIHAYAVCTDTDGVETLRSAPRGSTVYDFFIQCPTTSNTSLLIVSAAKRLTADALRENTTANATGVFDSGGGASVLAINLRKTYSFTVGRLGWKWQDLGERYGAECQSENECKGLYFELAGGKWHLVAGSTSLPLGLVNEPYYQAEFKEVDQHPLPIVTVIEPTLSAAQRQYEAVAGDFLLPHNVRNLSWDMSHRHTEENCQVVQEDRQQLVLNNHLYMESTLQSTYAAAMFFLFQNAAVRDTLTRSHDNKTTLAFDGNVQNIDVRISIPSGNAMLTYIGCCLLTGTLFAAFCMVAHPVNRQYGPAAMHFDAGCYRSGDA